MYSPKHNRFVRGTGCYKCQICGNLTRDTGDNGYFELCPACYELECWRNRHSDYDHKHKPNPRCPICQKIN